MDINEEHIHVRFIEGLFSESDVASLGRLADSMAPSLPLAIGCVDPNDLDAVQDMVTSVAVDIPDSFLEKTEDGTAEARDILFLKKFCVALRAGISGYRMVVDYGNGKENVSCALSIKTRCVQIHLPLDVTDKRLEKCVAAGISAAAAHQKNDGRENMLCYYVPASESMTLEHKDDYVRRKYFDSGLITAESLKAQNSR